MTTLTQFFSASGGGSPTTQYGVTGAGSITFAPITVSKSFMIINAAWGDSTQYGYSAVYMSSFTSTNATFATPGTGRTGATVSWQLVTYV